MGRSSTRWPAYPQSPLICDCTEESSQRRVESAMRCRRPSRLLLVIAATLLSPQPAAAAPCRAKSGAYAVERVTVSQGCPKRFISPALRRGRAFLQVGKNVRCGTRSWAKHVSYRAGCRYECGPQRRIASRDKLRYVFSCQARCQTGKNLRLGLGSGRSCGFTVDARLRYLGTRKNAKAALPNNSEEIWRRLRAGVISERMVGVARRSRLLRALSNLKVLGAKRSSGFRVAGVLGRLRGAKITNALGGLRGSSLGGLGIRGLGARPRRLYGISGVGSRGPITAELGRLRMSPRLQPMAIQRQLKRALPEIRRCLGKGNKAGDVKIVMMVGMTDGAPKVQRFDRGPITAKAQACVEALTRSWTLPAAVERPGRLIVSLVLARR